MVDTLAIGASAINAYRQSLSTTSNNIANVNTPGYTRRDLQIAEGFPVAEGTFQFGSGSAAISVGRAYDEFIEKALRDSTSDLEVNEPILKYTNRIIDIMGSEAASLSGALDRFFNSAEQLSTDPRSAALRGDFLSASEIVAGRFNDLALQVDNIADESETALRGSVDEVNAITSQLFKVNQQLNRRDSIHLQPPGLVDQRDTLLRDLSALVKIGVRELDSGQVIVNFGGSGRGFEIVTNLESKEIGVFSSSKSSGADLRLLLDPNGAKRPLPSAVGGALGGALSFRGDVLRPVRVGMDHLAKTFAAEVNNVHRNGLDGNGAFGKDLFRASTRFVASTATASGPITASAQVFDPSKATTEALELIYRASSDSWDVLNLVTRERLGEVATNKEVDFNGIRFNIAGEPINGDVVIFSPEERPARTFEVLIKDLKQVAVAATMRAIPGGSNASDADASLALIAKENQPTGFQYGYKVGNTGTTNSRQDYTISASVARPAVQVEKGTQGAQILFDIKAGSDQKIQVLTREGVHVAGSTLSQSEANALMALDSGFGEGTFNNTYLNQSGTNAYLDTEVKLGVSASTETVTLTNKDADTGAVTTVSSFRPPQLLSNTVSPNSNSTGSTQTLVAAGAVQFNGQSLGALTLANGDTLSADKMASYFNTQFSSLSVTGVEATAENVLRMESFDPTKSLTINGTTISYSAASRLDDFVTAINDKSSTTGVRAFWNSDTGMALTNTTGNEGKNIVIGVSGSDSISSLGLVAGTYAGVYQIESKGIDSAAVPASFNATKSLVLNGTAINYVDSDSSGAVSLDEVAASINGVSSQTNVRAVWSNDLGYVLTGTTGNEGASFTVGVTGSDTVTSLGLAPGTYTGKPALAEISLTLSGTGAPSDLGRLGMATGVIIDGPVPDDLAIFVTGTGRLNTTLRAGPAIVESASYPASPFKIDFTSSSIYTITDTATNTVVAKRGYVAGGSIDYQGISVSFSDIPQSGDSFTVEANTDGLGSNENMLRLIELGKEQIISGQTFSEAYRDIVSGTGSRATIAEMNREAMMVVRDQAQADREAAVGVNLDEEAADLIRFQQAYQAAAQVIQMSQRLFETLIQVS